LARNQNNVSRVERHTYRRLLFQ